MGLCIKTEADNIPVDLGGMVVDSLGNDGDGDGDGDGDSRDSRNRIEDENDAESPKIRKKTWSFRALKTNFSRGTRGGGQNGENPSVYGGLMMFLHT